MRNINAVDAMGRLELLDGDNAAVDYVNVLLKGNSQSTAVFEINLSKIASKNPVFTSRLKVGGNSIESKAVVLVSEKTFCFRCSATEHSGERREGVYWD